MSELMEPGERVSPAVPQAQTRCVAVAGAVGAGMALGVAELVAGLSDRVPSAISSVGAYVVEHAPPAVARFSIELLGTADKGALAVGTVLISLALGAGAALLAERQRWIALVAFAAFGVLGAAAAVGQPDADPLVATVVIGAAAIVGWLTYDRLRRVATRPVPFESPSDYLAGDRGRRRFLWAAGGLGVAAAASGVVGRSLIISRPGTARSELTLPAATETVNAPGTDASFPVAGLTPIVVPNGDFYRIDTALIVPRPNPSTWTLTVDGMVDRPFELAFSDLLAMPLHEQYVTLSCVSNQVGGNLVGNAKWTGVRLTELLERAGVQPGADQLVSYSVDGWGCGFPTELAFDGRDPMVAIGMNDELLPAAHGFPARLVVPGLYGYVSATKWLQRIELSTWEGYDGYWIPRGWAKEGPIKTQSRIDVPGRGVDPTAGAVVVAGVAWAPNVGIDRVEVRVDDGEWQDAALTSPLSDASWVQWRIEVPLDAGDHTATVRATDATGTTQTDEVVPPAPDGATGWHSVDFSVA